MTQLGPAEMYLISVIGMDDDYEPLDTIDQTPAGTAHEILAARSVVAPSRVKRALEAARRESRS